MVQKTTQNQDAIRILLIDDHALFRGGVRALLKRHDDMDVVGESSDALDGIKRVKALKPDVVLLDLHMPGMSGLEALKLLRQDLPDLRIIMLTVSEDSDDLAQALYSGADGYLLKNVDAKDLVEAIRKVKMGESVVSPEMTAKLVQTLRRGPDKIDDTLEKLTARERDVLGELASGASNKEIARTLDLAESTVKIHLQSVLRKLKLNNRVQAAIYAVEHGLGGSSQ